jgi:hypothetical protein
LTIVFELPVPILLHEPVWYLVISHISNPLVDREDDPQVERTSITRRLRPRAEPAFFVKVLVFSAIGNDSPSLATLRFGGISWSRLSKYSEVACCLSFNLPVVPFGSLFFWWRGAFCLFFNPSGRPGRAGILSGAG